MKAWVEETRVFDTLNASGSPLAAAVAYSLVTKAKREWIRDFRSTAGHDPSDEELAQFFRGYGETVLGALLEKGGGLFDLAVRRTVATARPAIVAEALHGGFWRAFWPSFSATVAFSLALAAVAFSAALLGFGLPVSISVARG